ncbi:MAG: MotA/TolQ/ExbB proton channel family protein [Planctomycetota bacterium]|nr:MotA/TolQ/ExbB proton channel family protein [Planctomycetota bacterium]
MVKRRNGWIVPLAALAVPLFAAPALAAEEHAGGSVNYFMQFLRTGDAVGTTLIWFCLFTSIAVVSLIIQNLMHNRTVNFIPPDLSETLERLLAEKNYREAIELTAADTSPFGQAMRAALAEAPRGYQAMELAIEEAADAVGSKKVRGLVWLEVAGAAGPMIGLFGTVFGMILTFTELVAAGGSPKASALAGGIATSLVCTFWGLVVGIPGVISASIFKVQVEGLTVDVIVRAKSLIAGFRPGVTKKPAAAPAGAAKPAPSPA